MKKETEAWLKYSEENLHAAKVLFESKLFNPCLYNIQQSIEKSLKSIYIEKQISFKKTHSIMELNSILKSKKYYIELSDDECDFLDSIYLPSKYPLGSALPYYYPDEEICKNSINIAERVLIDVKNIIK